MSTAPLLIEIGCEEIPARMIPPAATELASRIVRILDRAELSHGPESAWGGSRRLAVRIDDVEGRQSDREQLTLGPPASAAFGADGSPTRAALGFAKKQGIPADQLTAVDTDKGSYVGVRSRVTGRTVGQILAEALPAAVEGMAFPKTMRWADGRNRWVRPVHWVLALHGEKVLPLELFGIASGNRSSGHRFLGKPSVCVADPGRYADALESVHVLVDPARRRERILAALDEGARQIGGELMPDLGLLQEVVDLVEWPGVVAGRFDPKFLELPRELLVTTLRHHQKCFSVQDGKGGLIAGFLAVTNTDRDPEGHIRRGNEWVVGGRLDDARFFWEEDREAPLASRLPQLAGVVFHARCGSYADKAGRVEGLGAELARSLGVDEAATGRIRLACRVAKADLVTGLVGEFPELQGIVGGLLLEREGADPEVARAVYEHYRPMGRSDAIPSKRESCVVALADKLDSIAELLAAGERPTGSRDPFGLRRAANGIFRILIERELPLTLQDLFERTGQRPELLEFLHERLIRFLRDAGYSSNEILAVIRPRIGDEQVRRWTLADLRARLEAIKQVRGREDFVHLVKLTERVDNILTKNVATFAELAEKAGSSKHTESEETALDLERLLRQRGPSIAEDSEHRRYDGIVRVLSEFIEPVDRFFQHVLVVDPSQPAATLHRSELLSRLKDVLTRYFDIRELAGQADRSTG